MREVVAGRWSYSRLAGRLSGVTTLTELGNECREEVSVEPQIGR